jgi:alpha-1,3-rhamnosyl/mannosyltransferase
MPYRVNVPTIVTIYDLTPQLFPQYVSARARWLFRITTRLALRSARHVITISEATRRDLLYYYPFPAQRVTAVPLAPDPRFRPQTEAEIARIRTEYNLPECYVLYFGINKPHKNLLQLLTAWQLLSGKTADIPLVIAGAWDERYPEAKMQAEALHLGKRIRFLGPISNADLPALYAGATLFVFPSRYEGFGLPVVEAMACGTAVTCAHTSSLPEVGGEAVLTFDPDNAEAMAAQIGRLLTDEALRQKLEQAGLAQARKFSWEKTAEQTLSLYRRFLPSQN